MIRSRKATSDAAVNRSVREAEGIVHLCWIDQLTDRCLEMEAAIERAEVRCEIAQRSLTAAQLSGDPQKIAASGRDLQKAVEAARGASLAWERTCQVLGAEAKAHARRSTDAHRKR
ncbi:hypothetical protein [Catenulispora sp. GP43]|uniref:hypothetical protein n=1 Tax=Catenulispora sp. GP43 TaxID=3156263 RepID=UPI0035123075